MSRDATIGGYVRLGLYPNLGCAWYWGTLVGPGRRSVVVIDHQVPLPAAGSLEIRATGLWADHTCEEPLERWSLGLEAFGVALDEPADAYRGLVGERTPLGFDLEWETDGEPYLYPQGAQRYEVPCTVQGEVLVGHERIELDAVGQRDHSWGVRDWWSFGWCWSAFRLDDGSRWHAVVVDDALAVFGYRQGDAEASVVTQAGVQVTSGPEGIPTATHLDIEGVGIDVDPLAWAPVLLEAPDGRVSRFPRAMARFRTSDGRTGLGWIEHDQPLGAPG